MNNPEITPKIRNKLQALYELAEKGSTPGEMQAARLAIDRLIKRYDLKNINPDAIKYQDYTFKYQTNLEYWLLGQLKRVLLNDDVEVFKRTVDPVSFKAVKEIVFRLERFDYIKLECAYEYFRRHMKKEWNRICMPEIKRRTTPSMRKWKRKQLQWPFFSKYCIQSSLYKSGDIKKEQAKNRRELQQARLLEQVQGGNFNEQVNNGLYLGN